MWEPRLGKNTLYYHIYTIKKDGPRANKKITIWLKSRYLVLGYDCIGAGRRRTTIFKVSKYEVYVYDNYIGPTKVLEIGYVQRGWNFIIIIYYLLCVRLPVFWIAACKKIQKIEKALLSYCHILFWKKWTNLRWNKIWLKW